VKAIAAVCPPCVHIVAKHYYHGQPQPVVLCVFSTVFKCTRVDSIVLLWHNYNRCDTALMLIPAVVAYTQGARVRRPICTPCQENTYTVIFCTRFMRFRRVCEKNRRPESPRVANSWLRHWIPVAYCLMFASLILYVFMTNKKCTNIINIYVKKIISEHWRKLRICIFVVYIAVGLYYRPILSLFFSFLCAAIYFTNRLK